MDILKKNYSVKQNLVFGVGLYCTFYIAYFLGGIAYLSPYIDDGLTPMFILCLFCYYVVGFLIGVISTDSGRKSLQFVHSTLLGGVILFFLYLIPFKGTFTNEIADIAYHGILKDMG